MMGSPETERDRQVNEGPQHQVHIGYRFALGAYPVTFDEYDHFCEATDREKPGDRGWGRGRRPVIFVSWYDAAAYCVWLSNKTGQLYRLPSEAEWEYACRSGTTTRYSWGDVITPDKANYTHSGHDRTTEVDLDLYAPNAWGLCDMHGNVQEWVEDVWNGSYEGAPTDGSAWTGEESERSSSARVIRGGSWNHYASACRSACRSWNGPTAYGKDLGFRIARTL